MDWDKNHLEGRVNTMDIVDAANLHVPALRKQVDLLVALSHSGISTAPRQGGEENASYYLASVPGIDITFTGHSHRVFPGPDYEGLDDVDATRGMLGSIPAVMPDFWGSELGVIDLTLQQSSTGWAITGFTAGTRPIADREGHTVTSLAANNQAIDAAVAPEHAQTLRWIREPIGRLTQPVTSYFALIGPDASLALVNTAQTWYATPLLPESVHHLPVLSAAAPFKEGFQSPDDYVDLSAGTIAIKNVADLYMYPNTVAAARVTGEELRDWLEHSAEVFNRIDPNDPAPQPLLNLHVPSYVFDVISGVTYEIDITQPARFGAHGRKRNGAHRIVNLRYNGALIVPEQQFVVITNNYRADSSHIVRDPNDIILRAPDQTRDIISRYILEEKTINVEVPRVWSFAPIGQSVTVTFKTSPAATPYLLRQKNISATGSTDDGYTEFAMIIS
jgi:2',3'-cyclic-nucleotide 2'-phosphodiesterase / 3'-nucleotidase